MSQVKTNNPVLQFLETKSHEEKVKAGFICPPDLKDKFFRCIFSDYCINVKNKFAGFNGAPYIRRIPDLDVYCPLFEFQSSDKRAFMLWHRRKGNPLYSDWLIDRLSSKELRIFACVTHFRLIPEGKAWTVAEAIDGTAVRPEVLRDRIVTYSGLHRSNTSSSFNTTLLERDWKAELGGGSVLRTMLNTTPEAAATGSTTSAPHVLAHVTPSQRDQAEASSSSAQVTVTKK
jgi:hypothetical protein